jgi:hypothetical protein
MVLEVLNMLDKFKVLADGMQFNIVHPAPSDCVAATLARIDSNGYLQAASSVR